MATKKLPKPEKLRIKQKIESEVNEEQRSCPCGLVTVEPVLFLFNFGTSLLFPTISALIYRKVCISRYPDEICNHLDKAINEHHEHVVQSDTAYWFLLQSLAYEIPVILTSFFYGVLSENFSRKLTLLLPTFGQLFSTATFVVQSVFIELHVGYILIGPFISGLFGGWSACNMASFGYLGDVTNKKNRKVRIAVAEATLSISIGLAFVVSGIFLDLTDFVFVVSTALVIYFIVVLYIVLFIKDPQLSREAAEESVLSTCWAIYTPKKVRKRMATMFRHREENGRMHVVLSFLILMTGLVGSTAGFVILYLYVRKQPLSWTQTLYGIYAGCTMGIGALGQLLVIPILRDRLHLRDTSILLCGILSAAGGLVTFAFDNYTWVMFLAAAIGIIGYSQAIILRSVLAKVLKRNELGKGFTLFGIIQNLSAIAAAVLYNLVYAATLKIWPSVAFLLGVGILIIPAAMTIVLGYDMKRREKKGDGTESGKQRKPKSKSVEPSTFSEYKEVETDCVTTDGGEDNPANFAHEDYSSQRIIDPRDLLIPEDY